MLCFVETDDLSSPLCAPSPTGGSTHLPCRAGPMCPAVLLLPFRVCRGGRLCPPARTGVGIRPSQKGSGLPRRCAPRNGSASLPRWRDVGTPSPTGGSTHLSCRAGSMCPAVLRLSFRVCRGGRLCAHWLAMTDFFDSLRGGALLRLCCFAGASSRKCNSCRNTLHETV